MKFAYLKVDNDEKRISIDEYTDGMQGLVFCADGHPLIAKRGTVVSHHFAHKIGCSCICSDNKGEWHVAMQDRAHRDVQEIRMYNSEGKLQHIADVCIPGKYVLEYQHSPMDEKTMREREIFYTSQGYHLVWIFHVPSWEYKIQKRNGNIVQLKYRQGPKYPLFGSYKGNVSKILDFDKQQLLLIQDQLGTTITGKIIEMSEFDKMYIGSHSTGSDTRPFHHSL